MTEREPSVNPFPAVAMAPPYSARSIRSTSPMVSTDALRQSMADLEKFLRADHDEGTGAVLAVQGEHGMGKTSLVYELLRRADQAADVVICYGDTAAGNVGNAYRNFLATTSATEVAEQVISRYRRIVAGPLAGPALDETGRRMLLEDGLDPQRVVESLSLNSGALSGQLKAELEELASGNENVATALSLLVRPGFREQVWSWLLGAQADAVLVERGITSAISTEPLFLTVMACLVRLLYQGTGRRLVLAVDELDKLFSLTQTPTGEIAHAFGRLLEACVRSNAYLILAGLRSFYGSLRTDIRKRISREVVMPRFTPDEAGKLIIRTLGNVDLKPFTRELVVSMVQKVGGRPRSFVELCHRLYELHLTASRELTKRDVLAAARDLLGITSVVDDARDTVKRILNSKGWRFNADHFLALGTDTRVDYWVTFGRNDAPGCAVLIEPRVLDESDVSRIKRRALAIRAVDEKSVIVLVVSDDDIVPGLDVVWGQILYAEPLIYQELHFVDEFDATLVSIGKAFEADANPDPGAQLEQLTRLQAVIAGSLQELIGTVRDTNSANSRRFEAVEQQLSKLSDDLRNGTRASADVQDSSRAVLPESVRQLFQSARRDLAGLVGPDGPLAEEFSREHVGKTGWEVFAIAALLADVVLTFQDTIAAWFAKYSAEVSSGRLPETAGSELSRMCRNYYEFYESIPLSRLASMVNAKRGLVSPVTDPYSRVGNLSTLVERAVRHGIAGP